MPERRGQAAGSGIYSFCPFRGPLAESSPAILRRTVRPTLPAPRRWGSTSSRTQIKSALDLASSPLTAGEAFPRGRGDRPAACIPPRPARLLRSLSPGGPARLARSLEIWPRLRHRHRHLEALLIQKAPPTSRVQRRPARGLIPRATRNGHRSVSAADRDLALPSFSIVQRR